MLYQKAFVYFDLKFKYDLVITEHPVYDTMRMYECNRRHENIGRTLYQHHGLFALKVLLISQSRGDNNYRLIPVNTVQSLPQHLDVCLTVRGTLSGCEWR